MGAQTKGNMADPRQRQITNERMQIRGEGVRSNQQPSQEQEVGIGNYEREQQQRLQRQAMAEQMQRQQSRVERSSANREQEQRSQQQNAYEAEKRSQYEKLIPQDLRNKVSFEDAYADRGPAAAREAEQKQKSGIKRQSGSYFANSGPNLSYFDDTLNSLESMKKNYDQQRSSNNTGIAFGPGRSSRGDVDLRRLLQDRMIRGN
jgi:hypothetical protein